jgi:hypothetical protein
MKSSELIGLLSSLENGSDLKAAIQTAIPAFRKGLAERGRSAPVDIQDVGRRFEVRHEHIQNLCRWYLDGDINAIELEYVASILDLSEAFHFPEDVAEAIFDLADPVANGEISRESVMNILIRLTGAA